MLNITTKIDKYCLHSVSSVHIEGAALLDVVANVCGFTSFHVNKVIYNIAYCLHNKTQYNNKQLKTKQKRS